MSCIITYNGQNFTQEDFLDYLKSQIPTSINTIKEGVTEVFKNTPELSSIGTQQQYSAYLETIFPDSKVKDILYHGTDKPFDTFDIPKIRVDKFSGIYFSTKKEEAEVYSKEQSAIVKDNIKSFSPNFIYQLPKFIQNTYFDSKIKKELKGVTPRVISVIINTKERINIIDVKKESLDFYNIPNKETSGKLFNKLNSFKENTDTVIYKDYLDYSYVSDVIVVKNPEQIHILGSKKDVDGFKSWVDKNQSNVQQDFNTPTDIDSFAEEAFKCK